MRKLLLFFLLVSIGLPLTLDGYRRGFRPYGRALIVRRSRAPWAPFLGAGFGFAAGAALASSARDDVDKALREIREVHERDIEKLRDVIRMQGDTIIELEVRVEALEKKL